MGNKERDTSRGGSERERKRVSGEELSHRHHASPPSSLVVVAAGAAESRRRHWGHRAVTESSREREVTSRERAARGRGVMSNCRRHCRQLRLRRRSSVAIHGVAGVHCHREEECHAEGEPTGERKRRRVCCEPAIVTLNATCHRRCEPLLLPFKELCSVAVLPPLEPPSP
ncbi:hypothetical protein AHAS_Ahas17G0240400 [Arachis hypogaea]